MKINRRCKPCRKRHGLIHFSLNRIDRRSWPSRTQYRLGDHGRILRRAWSWQTRWFTFTVDWRVRVDPE